MRQHLNSKESEFGQKESGEKRFEEDFGIVSAPKRRFPKIFWISLIILLAALSFVFVRAYNAGSQIFTSKVSFFKKIEELVFGGNAALQGESSGRINILLLGYGGAGHDGPYLTDSMILASVKPDTKQVLLISIPRDYWWQFPGGSRKINSAFSEGYAKNENFGQGGAEARQAVSELTGLDIPYYASLDFHGFVKAVDTVGGLDIDVPDTFTDSQYPNDATNGYLPPITFYKGTEHMDGARALEFARSRHAPGIEGSDFARSKRQELVLQAFKQKVKKLNLLTDSSKIANLLGILADHFHTNIDPSQILHLEKMLNNPAAQIYAESLDQDTGLICPGTASDGEWILHPCDGVSDAQIKQFFQDGLKIAQIKSEHPSIIMENAGIGDKTFDEIKSQLQEAGAQVYMGAYNGIKLDENVLYEIHPEPLTEKILESELDIPSAQAKPDGMVAHSDLVLIIGNQQ